MNFLDFSYKEFFITNFLFLYIKLRVHNYQYLNFSDYVYLCLYTYKIGYYENILSKFGHTGSYITASEMGRIFSMCLVRQIKQISFFLKNFYIVEIGAGSGLLAKELINSFRRLRIFFSGYIIFEKSSYLKLEQQRNLSFLINIYNIIWCRSLFFYFRINGIILANELFDALPFDCFYYCNFILHEKCVAYNKFFGFFFVKTQPSHYLNLFFLKNFYFYMKNVTYNTEVHIGNVTMLEVLCNLLNVGYVFIFDYGYLAKEYYSIIRNNGTLTSYYKHKISSTIFSRFGLQDLTTHVNFSSLMEISSYINFCSYSYISFAEFLINCGLLYVLSMLFCVNTLNFKFAKEVNMLISPVEMGSVFKVLTLSKKISLVLISSKM